MLPLPQPQHLLHGRLPRLSKTMATDGARVNLLNRMTRGTKFPPLPTRLSCSLTNHPTKGLATETRYTIVLPRPLPNCVLLRHLPCLRKPLQLSSRDRPSLLSNKTARPTLSPARLHRQSTSTIKRFHHIYISLEYVLRNPEGCSPLQNLEASSLSTTQAPTPADMAFTRPTVSHLELQASTDPPMLERMQLKRR